MKNYSLVLKNCNLVNENSIKQVDVGINNDRIEEISAEITNKSEETIDLSGKFIAGPDHQLFLAL